MSGKGKIGIGAVVRLRSGGPLMTVAHITDKNRAECVFFMPGDAFAGGVKVPVECLQLDYPAKAKKA